MKAIVAVDQNWGIGKEGKLLAHIPEDLKYFKEKTLGHVVVMGRRTLCSLPGGKPLPGRDTVVLSRDEGFAPQGVTVVHSARELRELLREKHPGREVFLCGSDENRQGICGGYLFPRSGCSIGLGEGRGRAAVSRRNPLSLLCISADRGHGIEE